MRNTFVAVFLLLLCQGKAQSPDTIPSNAAFELQKAQIDYYRSKAKEETKKSFWDSLGPAFLSLIGTFAGASLTFFGVRWSNNRQWQLEERKWKNTLEVEQTKLKEVQQNEEKKEVKATVAGLAKIIGAEVHSIIWLAYIAKQGVHRLTVDIMDAYDNEIKTLFKEDFAAQTHLALLDAELYEKMQDTHRKIYTIDLQIAEQLQQLKETKDDRQLAAIQKNFVAIFKEANELTTTLPRSIAQNLSNTRYFTHAVNTPLASTTQPASLIESGIMRIFRRFSRKEKQRR